MTSSSSFFTATNALSSFNRVFIHTSQMFREEHLPAHISLLWKWCCKKTKRLNGKQKEQVQDKQRGFLDECKKNLTCPSLKHLLSYLCLLRSVQSCDSFSGSDQQQSFHHFKVLIALSSLIGSGGSKFHIQSYKMLQKSLRIDPKNDRLTLDLTLNLLLVRAKLTTK